MKKILTLLALAALLIGTLSACTPDTTIEDYQELDAAFHALEEERELTMNAEIKFDLLAVEGAVVYVTTQQIRADGFDEVMELHHSRDQNGAPVSKIETIITDGMAYLDIASAMYFYMAELMDELESFGISMEDVPFDLLTDGPYTHFQYTDDMLQDEADRAGLYGAFTEEALEELLHVDDEGVFRIEVEGEAVDTYIDAVLEAMNLDDISLMLVSVVMVTEIEEALQIEMEEDFASWLRTGDLSDARLVIERARVDENTSSQTIELYVPDRVSVTLDATVVAGESTPIVAPEYFLTAEELGLRVEIWLVTLLEELMSEPAPVETSDVPDAPGTADTAHNPAFVGTWAWDVIDDYEYVFYADGSGTRGFTADPETLEWETTADGQLLIHTGWFTEYWEYDIDGDVLTISSLQAPGTVFSYIRR